jgi:hypothetical protein
VRLTDPSAHNEAAVLVTLSNPLNLAVVGNPLRRNRTMARHRARSRSRRHRTSKKAKRLVSKWRSKIRSKKFRGLRFKVHTRRGRVVHTRRKRHSRIRGSGRRGTVSLFSKRTGRKVATNPRRRGRGRFMNPGKLLSTAKSYLITPVMDLPKGIPALLKGNLIKHAGFALGGSVVAMVGGNMLQKVTLPFVAKIPGMSGAMSGGIVQRILGAGFAILSGSVIGRLGLKDQNARNAFVTGAAASALIEAVFPGRIGALLGKIPVVGSWIAPIASPVQGIAGLFGTDDLAMGAYVQAPGYQGVGAYVQAPGYQGVGAYVQAPGYQGVGTYVQAPSYEGSVAGLSGAQSGVGYAGDSDALAGNLEGMGSNMMSHLDA